MKLVHGIDEVRHLLREAEGNVGFVPTMGYLHEGHLELMRRARAKNHLVIISIFVNPLQFAPNEDLAKYPRDLPRDSALAEQAGVDILFAPDGDEMYPAGEIRTRVNVGAIGERVEGVFRPGHFDGVATVCAKLFNIVGPCTSYFGAKDAQQFSVIAQLVRDLDLPVGLVKVPTVREADGLAMSSRNVYLDDTERLAAAAIPRALFGARDAFALGTTSAAALADMVRAAIAAQPGVTVQYVEVVDPVTFQALPDATEGAIIAVAAFVGGTRLIDNIEVGRDVAI